MYSYRGQEYESLVEFLYEYGLVADWEERTGGPVTQIKYFNNDKPVAEVVYDRSNGEILEFTRL